MSKSRLTSFSTRGNQSFNNLIRAQFNAEDPNGNRAKNPKKYPNEGRKVLLFSDSRQRAATLARDMSEEADTAASRQLFMCALANAMSQKEEISLDQVYGYFLHEAVHHNVSIFDSKFREDCNSLEREEERNQRRSSRRQRQVDLSQYTISKNSTNAMQEQLLRLYCGNFNTLMQDALSWVEPMDKVLDNTVWDVGEELGINLMNNNDFEVILKYLKYPSEGELNESYYPVGTLYEIKTKYTKDELINIYKNSIHDSEIKELKFYDKYNYKEVYSYDNKADYLDELFKLLFD